MFTPWNKGKKLSKKHKIKLSKKARERKHQNINKSNCKEIQKKAKVKKVCLKCNKSFKQKSPRQKYCGSIKDKIGCSWEIAKSRPKRKPKDPDYFKKYYKKWAKENPEKVKAKQKKWELANPEKASWTKNKRNRMKKVAKGNHTYKEWAELKKKFKYRCAKCGQKEPFKNQKSKYLTEDHIIPLSKEGTDFIINIQPLCHSCNCKKSNKIT